MSRFLNKKTISSIFFIGLCLASASILASTTDLLEPKALLETVSHAVKKYLIITVWVFGGLVGLYKLFKAELIFAVVLGILAPGITMLILKFIPF